ncbi:MAG: fibronectin type III domain-containing protein [Erysipelotrichaceae bacterium]|nr:fibronectin type III domain-containing protein [Erysipelotrichaceae bacterium]
MRKLKQIFIVILTVMMVLTNIPSAYAVESDGDSSDTPTSEVESSKISFDGGTYGSYTYSFAVAFKNDNESIIWDGTEKKPEVTVEATAKSIYSDNEEGDENTTILEENTDYTVSYSNNISVGTATVTITAADGSIYTGTLTKEFTIAENTSDMSITLSKVTTTSATIDYTKFDADLTYNVTVTDSSNNEVYSSSTTETTLSTGNVLSPDEEYTVNVTATDSSNNQVASASTAFTTKSMTTVIASKITTTTASFNFAASSNNGISYYKAVVTDASGKTIKTINPATGGTSYSLTGLTKNTKYTITVTAYTTDGASYTVASNSFTTKNTTSITTSAITTTTAKYKFTAISGNSITSYKVILKDSSGNTVKTVNPASSNTTLSFSGLTANKTYTITVQAITSDATYTVATKSFTTKKTTSITTSAITTTTAKYKFATISNNGITSYKVTLKDSSGNTVKTVNPASSNTTLSFTGLTANKTYTITVTAITSDATYTVATKSFTTKKTTSITTSSITSSSAKYKFTSITDNGIKSYKVVVKNSSGKTIKTINSAKGNTTYSLSGLSQNTKYTITVTATTSDATYTVATKTFTTLPTVAKVSASTKAGNEMALVSWKKISGASGYQVYRSTSKNGTYTNVKTITSGSTTSYTNYLLTANKTYYYKVRAYKTVNGAKVYGSFSAVKSVKPKAATSSTYYLRVNIKTNCTVAYAKNFSGKWVAVKAFVTSAGANGASKAIIGTHYTMAKYRWKYMHENCYTQYATRIVGHYLFHSVPYSKAKPNTLWTASYNKLGNHASAGCIRMDVISSKWIYDHCPLKTKVVVTYSSSDALTKPTAKKISSSVTGAKRTWDPTDPDSSNPWKK